MSAVDETAGTWREDGPGAGVLGGGTATAAPLPGAAAAAAQVMTPRTRLSLAVLAAALVLGVAGDGLLRATPWGLNLALWVALACGAVVALACGAVVAVRRWSGARTVEPVWLAGMVALAALMAWRDSPTLKGATLWALAAVVALAVYRAQGGAVRLGGVGSYLLGGVRTAAAAAFGAAVLLGRNVGWRELPRSGWSRHAGAVLRGVLIAGPLLLVFGALLASADAVFGGLLEGVFQFDLPLVLFHVFLTGMLAWMAAGVLRALFLPDGVGAPTLVRPAALSLGTTEVAMALGSLNALFLTFVAVQVRYLFGGPERVTVPGSTLTYAEYARSGFFELVTVAGLVLPLLLGLHWLLRGGAAQERVFRWLAGIQLVLLGVILASAARRMWLYQEAYGLTELRLYTSAFMGWLAIVFAWFAATVLRGRREQFAFGALVAGLATTAGLQGVNPDALIVRVNAARIAQGQSFDAAYAARLSGDAVPALLAVLPQLDAGARCEAATTLLRRWDGAGGDWRAWSWGRSGAVGAVAAQEKALRAVCPRAAAVGTPAERRVRTTLTPAIAVAPAAAPGVADPRAPRADAWTAAAVLASPFEGRVELVVERQVGQGSNAEYHRRLGVRVNGATVQQAAMSFDSGGHGRVNVYATGHDLYLLRDASDSYSVDLGRRLVLRDVARQPARGRYLGAFDVDERQTWRFISVAEQPTERGV